MNSLHLSLLILAILVLIALYWIGRSRANADKPKASRKAPPPPSPAPQTPPGSDQMDLWKLDSSGFDEFGVGQPRRRGMPRIDPILTGEPAAAPPAEAPAQAEVPLPKPEPAVAPPAVTAAKRAAEPAPVVAAALTPASEPQAPAEEKIVALYIAEREGTYINGVQIHSALRAAGLRYGEKMKIYERIEAGKTVFGVASLLKPGHLDPAAADSFSTPGLSMFMVLPGPRPALEAFDDFLATGYRLAEALNAQLFDTSRAPLDEALGEKLRAEVSGWAARNE